MQACHPSTPALQAPPRKTMLRLLQSAVGRNGRNSYLTKKFSPTRQISQESDAWLCLLARLPQRSKIGAIKFHLLASMICIIQTRNDQNSLARRTCGCCSTWPCPHKCSGFRSSGKWGFGYASPRKCELIMEFARCALRCAHIT